MNITQVIETPEGAYTFSANLTKEQHAFLLEFAIKELLRAGMIPFVGSDKKDSIVLPPADEVPH